MGRLTGCCCCFELRDGARAVGITHLVLGSMAVVCHIIGAAMLSQEDSVVSTEQIVMLAFQFAACILHLVFNALLVHGVGKNSRGMLLAWLIYSGIIYGLYSLALAIGFVGVCIFGVFWLILLVLAFGALLGVFWYWFAVVVDCYREMRQENGFVYGKQDNEGEGHAL